VFEVDKAVRQRKCHSCTRSIPSGEYHIKYSTSGITRNICQYCMTDKEAEVEKANRREGR